MEYCGEESLIRYCTINNFVESLLTISEDLSVVGVPAIAAYSHEDPGPAIVSLINSVWTLLKHRQRLVNGKRDLEEKVSGLSNEISRLKGIQDRLKNEVKHIEDCLAKEKLSTLLINKDGYEKSIKNLKLEIQELKTRLKNRESQFKHDIRKQQIDISSLQTKLRTIISKEKGRTWKGPVDSSAHQTLSGDAITTSKEDLYKKSIYRLENNIQTLVKENLELRKLLDDVNNDLSHVLSKTDLDEKP